MIIVMGKVTTDFIWILTGMFMVRIFPTHFVTLVAACKNSFSLIVSTTLPYIKYGMETIGLSIFPVSGVYYLFGTICS